MRILTRLIDFGLSLIGLVGSLPNIVLVAVLIKLTSRGPIFIREEAVGVRGRTVSVIKFRSMTVGMSPRVTMVGRWLRRTRMDELPMYWSALVDDYSFLVPYLASVLPKHERRLLRSSHVATLVAADLAAVALALISAQWLGYRVGDGEVWLRGTVIGAITAVTLYLVGLYDDWVGKLSSVQLSGRILFAALVVSILSAAVGGFVFPRLGLASWYTAPSSFQ